MEGESVGVCERERWDTRGKVVKDMRMSCKWRHFCCGHTLKGLTKLEY